MPGISVVVTTYNRESGKFTERNKFLRKALTSVLDQTYQDFELIVVDDHSTDNTEKYVKKLQKAEPRLKYIRLPENSGSHSKPKNIGSRAATAPLIAYLDDDNWWEKDHLQALYKALEENPDYAFAYCDRNLHAKGMPIGTPPSIDWHPAFLQQQNHIDTSDVLIRKEVLEEIGGWDETLKKFADWNLFVRIAKTGKKAVHVPLRLSNYLLHEGSAQLRHKSLVGQDGRPLPTFSPHACYIWPDKTEYGQRPEPKVCVITVTWNRPDYLRRTLDTMIKKAGYGLTNIIYNNGDRLPEDIPALSILGDGENHGVPYAYNKALEEMEKVEEKINRRFDIVVLTDNDADFKSDNWLKDIVDLFQRQQKMVVSPYIEGLRDNPGGAKRTGIRTPDGREVVPRDGYVGPHYLGFVQHMGNIVQAMPRKFWDGFRLNEDTFKHGTQSFQIAEAALKRGYVLAYMENIKVEHMLSTEGQEKDKPEYMKESARMKTVKYEPDATEEL